MRAFMRVCAAVLAIALAWGAPTLPALAQPTATATDPYDDLLEALQPKAEVEAAFAAAADRMIATLMAPGGELIALAEGDAATADRLRTAIRGPVLRQIARSHASMAADFNDLFKKRLSPADARDNAAFWRSAVGREVLRLQLDYVSNDLEVEPLMSDKPVTMAETRAEAKAGLVRLTGALSADDRARVAQFMSSAAGMKMRRLKPEMVAIQNKWANFEPTEQDTKELEAAILSALPAE